MNRLLRVFGPATLLLGAALAMVAGLIFGGGAAPLAIGDPGDLVRWGVPTAKLLVNLGAAGTIGALVLALWALPDDRKEYGRALDVAAGSAALLAVASGASALLVYLSVTGQAASGSNEFGAGFGLFLTQIELGQAWLTTTLLAAIVTVLAYAVRNKTAVFWVAVLAAFSLLPLAQQGHAAGASGHNDAVSALGLHLLFASIWLGGLITLVIAAIGTDRTRLVVFLRRYSTLALVSVIVVAISGYVSAALRIGSLDQLTSAYGLLVAAKVGVLVALGVLGALWRRWLIERVARAATAALTTLVLVELAFMGLATGFATALGRTATPVSEDVDLSDLTPAQMLTGELLPPPPSLANYFSLWHPDIIWVLITGFGATFYVWGVLRLRQRGDHWPIHRTLMWLGGMAVLFYLTGGGVAVYEQFLFSAHMLGHMGLTMLVPILLAPAAPVTLALRAIEARTDGSRGSREWILIGIHSRYGQFITNPVVASILFAVSLWVLYFTPLLRWTMADHIGHEIMIVHFLVSGYLFVQALIGTDPVLFRFPYPLRLVVLLVTMTVHAFFGVTLMSSTGLLAADWFGAMGWGTPAIIDQQIGGGIAWGIGELPIIVLALTLVIQWSRQDERETRRKDRNADRTGEAELNAYNERLARMAARDQARGE